MKKAPADRLRRHLRLHQKVVEIVDDVEAPVDALEDWEAVATSPRKSKASLPRFPAR
jgi:hypothetical protein